MNIRRMFESFQEYGWETPSHEIAAKVGLKTQDIIRLDTNTSPFAPTAELKLLAKTAEKAEVNQYPDTTYLGLREGLAAYCGLDVDRFVVTNGADEGLDIATKTLLDNGDDVVIPVPTYSMFRVASEIMGARVVYARRSLDDFVITADKVLESVTKRTKLVFLCNPNSPTGNPMPLSQVEKVAKETRAAVLIDEAYFEFWGKSAASLTAKYDNLVVCRTFSKAFSMAGVRVGYLIAGTETVRKLNLVRPPNSLTVISIALAEAALRNLGEMRKNVGKIISERTRVFKALGGEVEAFPSDGNFVLFRVEGGVKGAAKLHKALMTKGLVLRSYGEPSGIGDCLRVTIGTREMNDKFLSALKAVR